MSNYQCPRCHYITDRKSNLKNHYNRKKVCKTTYSRISIKDCKEQLDSLKKVITNVLNEHNEIEQLKSEVENLKNKLNEKEKIEDQFIYLIQTREFIKSGECIYKLGKTRNPKGRLTSYPKGSRIYLLLKCEDCDTTEKELIKLFTDKFNIRNDIGNEYFYGNVDEMSKLISCLIHL
jgi:hypothetical protein